jgi:hypothetical protein
MRILNKRIIWAGIVFIHILHFGNAAIEVVNPTGVTGHDGGNWPSTLGHLTDMLNTTDVGFLTGDHNTGMTVVDANDPSTWTYSGGSWGQEYKGNSRLSGALNSKIGWIVIDLGSEVTSLSNMFFWNCRSQSTTENMQDFNLYYSSGVGIDALPAMPNSKGTTGDYDFSSGDWTKLNAGGNLVLPVNGSNNNTPQLTIDLEDISAQYLGIEVLTTGDNTKTRIGIAQIEIARTRKPPSGTLFKIE